MATYVFRTEDGDHVELNFSFAEEVPTAVVLEDGRNARRVVAWEGGIRLRGKGWAKHPDRDAANRKWGPQ